MLIRTLDATRASDRNVKSDGWESARMLLKQEGMGFSFHITTIHAGAELRMRYRNHLESVYVMSGVGSITDLASGETHPLAPGTLYALDRHDAHVLRAETEIVTACVFNPPVTGREVHDEQGGYLAEDELERPERVGA